jgi:hypothetical protein
MRLRGVEPPRVFHPQGPQAAQAPLLRAENDLDSQIGSGCVRLKAAFSEAHWRTNGAPPPVARVFAYGDTVLCTP